MGNFLSTANLTGLRFLHCRDSCNDVFELGLERGTTDKEAIDIWLCRKLTSILGAGRPTILDSDGRSNFWRRFLGDHLADTLMRCLCICCCGSFSCTDCPNRLISEHHLGRVEQTVNLGELNINVLQDNFQALLANLQGLTDAEATSHTCIQDELQLGRQ